MLNFRNDMNKSYTYFLLANYSALFPGLNRKCLLNSAIVLTDLTLSKTTKNFNNLNNKLYSFNIATEKISSLESIFIHITQLISA